MTWRHWKFIGLALLIFAMSKWLMINWYLQKKVPENALTLRLSCTPSAVCLLPHGGELRFNTPPVREQAFTLSLFGVKVAQASVSFTMPGMNMGHNVYRLTREGDEWRAQVTLPACLSGRRDWVMLLEVGEHRYELPFTAG